METFQHTLVQLFVLAVIVACGFVARKTRLMNDTFDSMLSQLVMSVTLPALILDSVLSSTSLPSGEDIALTIGYAALYFLMAGVVSFVITRLVYRKMSSVTRGAHEFMMMYSNTGFLGYPVLAAVLDPSAVLYAAIFNIVFNITVFSYGVMLISGGSKDGERHSLKGQLKALKCTLIKPVLIASYLAAVLAVAGITDSGPIGQACSLLGGMTSPATMLITGSAIAKMALRDVVSDGWSYVTALIRLAVMPLLVYFVFGLFVHDQFILAILVLLAAMPVAANGTMLCLAYSGDSLTMARCTFLSTVFALVTLPLIALLVV